MDKVERVEKKIWGRIEGERGGGIVDLGRVA